MRATQKVSAAWPGWVCQDEGKSLGMIIRGLGHASGETVCTGVLLK